MKYATFHYECPYYKGDMKLYYDNGLHCAFGENLRGLSIKVSKIKEGLGGWGFKMTPKGVYLYNGKKVTLTYIGHERFKVNQEIVSVDELMDMVGTDFYDDYSYKMLLV